MRRTRLSFVAAVAMASTAALVAAPSAAQAAPKPNIPVQLIAMNDFHGRIQNTSTNDTQTGEAEQVTAPGPDGQFGTSDDVISIVGGSANVAGTVHRLQSEFAEQNGGSTASWFVAAGDLISASPFASSIFKDEPTIEVLNAMGLDASSVGNHEFDRGTQELRRISAATDGQFSDDVTACEGVTPGVDGCYTDSTDALFHGTDYPYLAANVVSKQTGQPMLPPYQIFDVGGGKKFALIGVVTKDTPNIVSPDGVADVQFLDEADAINYWTPRLIRQGIKAIGVLIHEGGAQTGPTSANPNGCDTLTGPILDINRRVHDQVDLIVSAHTHQAYNCLLPVPHGKERLVTSAGFYGRLVSDIRLEIRPQNGDVDRHATYQATNVPVLRNNPDPRVQKIVDYWVERSAEAGNRVIGEITDSIQRVFLPNGADDRENESSLGNFVADAQLWRLQQEDQFGDPVIAFMNPGGLRDDLNFAESSGGEADGEVTFQEAFDVQPFGNTVNAVTLTGAQIKQVLEEQFQQRGQRSRLILGTNDGFTYSYNPNLPSGNRVIADSIKLKGVTIDPAASYRVVANSFLTAGGDDFTTFTSGTDLVTGPVDSDALVAYFEANSPLSPPPANHSRQVG